MKVLLFCFDQSLCVLQDSSKIDMLFGAVDTKLIPRAINCFPSYRSKAGLQEYATAKHVAKRVYTMVPRACQSLQDALVLVLMKTSCNAEDALAELLPVLHHGTHVKKVLYRINLVYGSAGMRRAIEKVRFEPALIACRTNLRCVLLLIQEPVTDSVKNTRVDLPFVHMTSSGKHSANLQHVSGLQGLNNFCYPQILMSGRTATTSCQQACSV